MPVAQVLIILNIVNEVHSSCRVYIQITLKYLDLNLRGM
jgi:hypothetical protein